MEACVNVERTRLRGFSVGNLRIPGHARAGQWRPPRVINPVEQRGERGIGVCSTRWPLSSRCSSKDERVGAVRGAPGLRPAGARGRGLVGRAGATAPAR